MSSRTPASVRRRCTEMRTLPAALVERFHREADQLAGVDEAVYRAAGRDVHDPVFGLGPRDARIAFFGRDPGRDEIHIGVPFIGAGGRQLRRVLYRRHYHGELVTTEQALAAGEGYFWANTVPYKPLGNKAWSMGVKRRFQPLVAEVLSHQWTGRDVITLGREAFFWFGINQPAALRQHLTHHWRQADRFETDLTVDFVTPEGEPRPLTLHPLPHPSPLNATWFKHFPGLLEACLERIEGKP